jgi:Icc-related predicted phosphoesterase
MPTLLLALTLCADPGTFAAYAEGAETSCNGPLDRLPAPEVVEYAGYRYSLEGSLVSVKRLAPRSGPLKLGVLSAIKDLEPDTRATLERFIEEFEAQDVEAILVGGDTGEEPGALNDFYAWLAQATTRPVLTVVGNSERPGAHSYAIARQRAAGKLNLLNGVVVRRAELDGVEVVTLNGYYDKHFLHMAGACVYAQADVEAMVRAAKQAKGPTLLLVHGPPRQAGKAAIDFVPEHGNVGDPELTKAIAEAKIRFGVHGHILEAGGKATDVAGKVLKPDTWLPSMFLNPGSANPLPWKLNGGGTSYGLAAVVTLANGKARYQVLRAPKPPPSHVE